MTVHLQRAPGKRAGVSVLGHEACRWETILRLHDGRCEQVLAAILCQGAGLSRFPRQPAACGYGLHWAEQVTPLPLNLRPALYGGLFVIFISTYLPPAKFSFAKFDFELDFLFAGSRIK